MSLVCALICDGSNGSLRSLLIGDKLNRSWTVGLFLVFSQKGSSQHIIGFFHCCRTTLFSLFFLSQFHVARMTKSIVGWFDLLSHTDPVHSGSYLLQPYYLKQCVQEFILSQKHSGDHGSGSGKGGIIEMYTSWCGEKYLMRKCRIQLLSLCDHRCVFTSNAAEPIRL